MDELNVIKNTAQIVKYCKERECENCLFYMETNESGRCMWRQITPDLFEMEDIITKWVNEIE